MDYNLEPWKPTVEFPRNLTDQDFSLGNLLKVN